MFQQESGAVGTGLVNHLVQRFIPLGSFLWIQIHNPLVQFLMHGYFHYMVRRDPFAGIRPEYNVVMVRVQQVLESWSAIRQDTAAAVEDFPADEMEFRPVAELATFGEIARHI